MVKCRRCSSDIKTYSPMRKWCSDCRKVVNMEYVKARKLAKKK